LFVFCRGVAAAASESTASQWQRQPGLGPEEVSGFGCWPGWMLTKGLFWLGEPGREGHPSIDIAQGFLSEAAHFCHSVDCVDLFGRCGTRLLSHESVGNLALYKKRTWHYWSCSR